MLGEGARVGDAVGRDAVNRDARVDAGADTADGDAGAGTRDAGKNADMEARTGADGDDEARAAAAVLPTGGAVGLLGELAGKTRSENV